MKLLIFSAKSYEIPFLDRANQSGHDVTYTREALDTHSAIQASGYKAVSIFSGDDASNLVLEKLWHLGVRYIAIRSAGHNNVRIKSAKRLGFRLANVPDYSPHAIAEHATALLLAFQRNLISANGQVQEYDFSQTDLLGSNLHGKTVGIIGTGRIGSIMVKIMNGFGCPILACDLRPDDDLIELCNVTYETLENVLKTSDIISLHIPLTYDNHHLINKRRLALMKRNAILINTARGGLVDTQALIRTLENREITGYCTDVFEKEKGIFFKNRSSTGIENEHLKKLLSLPNVLLTPHQAFMTKEALSSIARTTFQTLDAWSKGEASTHELGTEWVHS